MSWFGVETVKIIDENWEENFSSLFLPFSRVGGYIPTYTNKGITDITDWYEKYYWFDRFGELEEKINEKSCFVGTVVVANKVRPLSSFSKQFYLT